MSFGQSACREIRFIHKSRIHFVRMLPILEGKNHEIITEKTLGKSNRMPEVTVLDANKTQVAARAKALGISRIPAVVIDGFFADCCAGGGVDANTLRAAGLDSAKTSITGCT